VILAKIQKAIDDQSLDLKRLNIKPLKVRDANIPIKSHYFVQNSYISILTKLKFAIVKFKI